MSNRTLSKPARLRAMLNSPDLEFIMEAHNGLSAKIVEETGFKGVWASGLSISAALGVRDNNEASWTQVLEVLEYMADATSIPILVDGDTGYGNFNNLRRVVKKFCQRGIAGICIEDKLFPKTNSFIGENQPLADMDEFCGKIKAGKDSQTDADFCLVARVEALIAGWGLDEALKRATAYHQAGADAILIHSKQSTADEVLAFLKEWGGRCPVVIVPTKYYTTPTDDFRDAGASMVIWANHNMRSAITAMRETSRQIFRDEHLMGVEPNIVTVKDVFDIQGNEELSEAEKRYLPKNGPKWKTVLLAASRGEALGELTADRPKCMIDVRGQPLLRRLVSTLNDCGAKEITVVRGYKKDKINLPSIHTADNPDFETTGEIASLACALDKLSGDSLIGYGDILFRHHILDELMRTDGDIVVTADALWKDRVHGDATGERDYVTCSKEFSPSFLDDAPVSLKKMATDIAEGDIHGEWVGLAKLTGRGVDLIRAEVEAMKADGTFEKASLLDLFTRLASNGEDIRVAYVTGQWLDVDDALDLEKARDFL